MTSDYININISSIKNGYLVAHAPSQIAIEQAKRTGVPPQAVIVYCKDFEEVVQALKNEWPVTVKK